jgi:hypothetical protein
VYKIQAQLKSHVCSSTHFISKNRQPISMKAGIKLFILNALLVHTSPVQPLFYTNLKYDFITFPKTIHTYCAELWYSGRYTSWAMKKLAEPTDGPTLHVPWHGQSAAGRRQYTPSLLAFRLKYFT